MSGLKVLTRLEGYAHAEYLEQRMEEEMQLEEEVAAYGKALLEYIHVQKSNGALVKELEGYSLTPSELEAYLEITEGNILITKSEYATYANGGDSNSTGWIASKHEENVKQMEDYFKKYQTKNYQLTTLKRQLPVRFLTDGAVTKGYNADGQLVTMYDKFENQVNVEYEEYMKGQTRIKRVYDGENKQIVLEYDADDKLKSVTDARGRRTAYGYDMDGYLTSITYPNGKQLTIGYENENIKTVESTDKLKTTLGYAENGQLTSIDQWTTVSTIDKMTTTGDGIRTALTTIEYLQETEGEQRNYTQLKDEVHYDREKYVFDGEGNVVEHYAESKGLVTKAEQYIIPTWQEIVTGTNANIIVKTAKQTSLNLTSLEDFVFDACDTETKRMNKFNLPEEVTTSWIDLTEKSDNQKTTRVQYTYDSEQKLLEEKRTLRYSTPESNCKNEFVTYTKYGYNALGQIVRTESYVEGEELTTGKTIEETVYDDKGNVKKTFTYNSLDTSSKFYTESDRAEDGQLLADYDATGEQKTEYRYVEGTNIVREQRLPNGSRFAYGHDFADTVTAISQSTDEGEENSNQTIYTYGLAAELRTGNHVVEYGYEKQRRLSSVKLDGNTYVTHVYEYLFPEFPGDQLKKQITSTYINGDVATVIENKYGDVLTVSYGGNNLLHYVYNTKQQLSEQVDVITGEIITYAWDTFNRMKKYTCGSHEETYGYDSYGRQQTATYGAVTYVYKYKDTAAREMERVTISLNTSEPLTEPNYVTIEPKKDCLGRNKGRDIGYGGTKIAEENITYRKVGDHATNVPVSMYFGHKEGTRYLMSDHLKYAYDVMGNITEIKENGELLARYRYDQLNRLVREDNKAFGKTWLYTYDRYGNILSKKETSFTLRRNVEEVDFTDVKYEYEGDKLMRYNGGLLFVYDAMGNPTTYRGGLLTWTRGRMLESYNGLSFTYDGRGRRLTKGSMTFAYDSRNRLLKQTSGSKELVFFYDNTGVAGVKCITTENDTVSAQTYVYRKDIQGNVVAILDKTGAVVVKYVYDAWGNHDVVVVDSAHEAIANGNPFRYRGYYYDTETDLYYLHTRYYDPETGRFVNMDSLKYLKAKAVNGLNLYAYCKNNPVMFVDEFGNDAILVTAYGYRGIPVVGHTALLMHGTMVVNGVEKTGWWFTQFTGSINDKSNASIEFVDLTDKYKDVTNIPYEYLNTRQFDHQITTNGLFYTEGYETVYLTGDYNASIVEAKEIAEAGAANGYNGQYNLLFNNCLHYIQDILMKGKNKDNWMLQSVHENPSGLIPGIFSAKLNQLKTENIWSGILTIATVACYPIGSLLRAFYGLIRSIFA